MRAPPPGAGRPGEGAECSRRRRAPIAALSAARRRARRVRPHTRTLATVRNTAMATLFVYGTLMAGEVLTALIDRVPASRPGERLAGWGGVRCERA